MKFGMHHPFDNPANRSVREVLNEELNLMRGAEDWTLIRSGPRNIISRSMGFARRRL
jgi:hypothetical protein